MHSTDLREGIQNDTEYDIQRCQARIKILIWYSVSSQQTDGRNDNKEANIVENG